MKLKQSRMVAYYRLSTAKQGQSGLGLEAQKAAVDAHIASAGCTLLGAYIEVETGTKRGLFNRPQLARALAHAKRAKATLIIAKLDRLSCNVAFITNLMESGVEFIACDNPVADKFTVHIFAAVAYQEAERISKRTKEALATAKARGKKLGNPQNLTREGGLRGSAAGIAVIRKRKVAAYVEVVPIVNQLKAQGLSPHAIAAELNDIGETTRSGRPWNPVQVSRLLTAAATE